MPQSDYPQAGLAAAVRQLRGKLSQEELARRAGFDRTWITHIEGGANPSYRNVRRLAAALGVSTAQLVELAEALENEKSPPTP